MFHEMHRLTSLFLAIVCASTIAIIATLPPTCVAQNSVPPTAVQAAKMPQYASRLARPAKRLLPSKPQAPQRAKGRRGPLDSTTIYENGPANGNTDAWTINFGFIVSDTFTIANDQTPVTGMTFAAWFYPGDTVTSVEISITSGENGGTSYFDQTVNFTMGSCTGNEFGFNVCTATGSFTGPTLNAGTYWVNLQNASVPDGDPVYWDENSGAGCQSPGCPSLASENSLGSIPSESFTILGEATTTTTTTEVNNFACPPEQPGFHDLRDLHSVSSDVAVDNAGNLYGTFGTAGSDGAGSIYKLALRAGNWFFSSLYSFLGGSNGSGPSGVIVGPGGALYGSATGGNQNCGNDGSSFCGVIYEARPSPAACASALCSWNETTIYEFSGDTDEWSGTVNAFDSAGNLYGIASPGAYGQGTIFELSPSAGGWTKKTLYDFPGGRNGGGPDALLVGHDGNLYGTAWSGGQYGDGVVFQLVPSGGGWTENVLYAFTGRRDGYWPAGLVQDSAGNLYGFDICYHWGYFDCSTEFYDVPYGLVFELSPYSGGWAFGIVYNNNSDCDTLDNFIHGLSIDSNGNLYVAEGGTHEDCDDRGCYVRVCGKVMQVTPRNYLVSGNADIFDNITSDANGRLYGTVGDCGGLGTPFRNSGMIWQYSP